MKSSKFKYLKPKLIPISILSLLIVIIFLGLYGIPAYYKHKDAVAKANYIPAPQQVNAVQAKQTDWTPTIRVAGQAAAVESTNVTAQVSGIVTEINFQSGDIVQAGQILFKLQTTQLEAQLKQAQAQLEIAQITYERYKDLVKTNAVSQQTFDEARAKYNEAEANVEAIEANIGYHTITAPFTGKIGIRRISLGNYFQQGDNAATLTMLSPIYLNFQVPQNYLVNLKVGDKIRFTTDSYSDKAFTATITAINSAINRTNSSIEVQATYENDNSHYIIVPGMYVNVSIFLPKLTNVIVLPRNAITYSLYGAVAYTLEPAVEDGKQKMATYTQTKDGKTSNITTDKPLYTVKAVNVTTQDTRDNNVIVSGVKADTWIVSSGQNKLSNGMSAVINNTIDFDYNKKSSND